MAQNLGDVVTINEFYAKNGFLEGVVNSVGQEFTSYTLIVNQSLTLTGRVRLFSNDSRYTSYITFESPKIIFNTIGTIGVTIQNNGYNRITFNDSSVNFDNVTYSSKNIGPISFSGSSSINITSSTNGKTIIKASTLTGTVTLDVEDGVQDGDTFLIEATDNQLVITDGEWIATPSTSGNITTYTLSKAVVQKPKLRMLYTIG